MDKLNNRIFTVSRTVLEILIQCVVFVALSGLIVLGIVVKPASYIFYVLMVVIPVVIMYIARHRVRKLSLFVVIHIIMIVGAALLGKTEAEATAYAACVIFATVRSVSLKLALIRKSEYHTTGKKNKDSIEVDKDEQSAFVLANERMSVLYAAVMIVGYIFGNNVKSDALMELETICFILFILLQIAANQIGKLNEMFIQNAGKSEFPANRIVNINIIMIVIISIFMILGMILFYNGRYNGLISMIAGIFGLAIKALLKLILMLMHEDEEDIMPSTKPEKPEGDEAYYGGTLEEMGDNPFMNALFEACAVVAIMALAIFAIVMVRRYAKRFRQAREEDIDEIEFIGKDSKEEKRKRQEARRQEKNMPLNAQYRKLFKKKVLSYRNKSGKKEVPYEALFPEEITIQRITNEEATATRITKAYEKARYSEEVIDRDELEFLKKHRK